MTEAEKNEATDLISTDIQGWEIPDHIMEIFNASQEIFKSQKILSEESKKSESLAISFQDAAKNELFKIYPELIDKVLMIDIQNKKATIYSPLSDDKKFYNENLDVSEIAKEAIC